MHKDGADTTTELNRSVKKVKCKARETGTQMMLKINLWESYVMLKLAVVHSSRSNQQVNLETCESVILLL